MFSEIPLKKNGILIIPCYVYHQLRLSCQSVIGVNEMSFLREIEFQNYDWWFSVTNNEIRQSSALSLKQKHHRIKRINYSPRKSFGQMGQIALILQKEHLRFSVFEVTLADSYSSE